MRRKFSLMSDIRIYAPVSLDDVVAGINEHRPDYPELIDFITSVDQVVADVDFTTELIRKLTIDCVQDGVLDEQSRDDKITSVGGWEEIPSSSGEKTYRVDTTLSSLAEGISKKPFHTIIHLFAEAMYLQQEREKQEEDAREEAEANKRKCASCNHPDTYHKGYQGPGACMFTCDCEGFVIKDGAPCVCGHDWEEHTEENSYACVHAVFGTDCNCTRFKMARM